MTLIKWQLDHICQQEDVTEEDTQFMIKVLGRLDLLNDALGIDLCLSRENSVLGEEYQPINNIYFAMRVFSSSTAKRRGILSRKTLFFEDYGAIVDIETVYVRWS